MSEMLYIFLGFTWFRVTTISFGFFFLVILFNVHLYNSFRAVSLVFSNAFIKTNNSCKSSVYGCWPLPPHTSHSIKKQSSVDTSEFTPLCVFGEMICKTFCTLFNCLLIFVIVALVISNSVLIWLNTQRVPQCPVHWGNSDQSVSHNERSVVFADLSEEEILQVRDYMSKIQGMDISFDPTSPPSADFLYMIELSLPKKQEVLRYLDANGPKPAREATAVVFHGSRNNISEYVVGPLPTPNYHRDVTLERYKREIPLTSRPVNTGEYFRIQTFLKNALGQVDALMKESFGLTGSSYQAYYDSMPRGVQSGDRQTWISICRKAEGYFIHPVGFEILIDHKSTNSSFWSIKKVLYNGRYFDTLAELRQQYETGAVEKIIYKRIPNYASLKPRKRPTGAGPQQFYAEGKRFSIENNNVVYLDWSFSFGLSPLRGMRVFDIKFRNERIVYELSVQDAMSVYGSLTPNIMLTKFLDGSLGIGACAYELVKGVDCPLSADYIDSVHYLDTDVPRRIRNSICVFEHNTGDPLRRHYSEDVYVSYGGLANSALVFRTITAIGNYDYMWNFIFYQSGSVEAKVQATGYIASSFKFNNDFRFGHQVAEKVTGNIHTHFLNFKVDLDVLGKS